VADLVTLATLRAAVRARGAVRLNSDTAIDGMINAGILRLHRRVASVAPDYLTVATPDTSLAVVKDTQVYTLPTAVWIVRGIDVLESGEYRSMGRLPWAERGLYKPPTSARTIRTWYIPKPTRLVNTTDTWDASAGWDEYVVLYALASFAAADEAETAPWFEQLRLIERDILREIGSSGRDGAEPAMVTDVRRVAVGQLASQQLRYTILGSSLYIGERSGAAWLADVWLA